MIKGVHALIFTDCFTAEGHVWSRAAGPYRVATELRELGLKVQVVDCFTQICVEDDELLLMLLEKFVGSDTLFVGFSSTFMTLEAHIDCGLIPRESEEVARLRPDVAAPYGTTTAKIELLIAEVKRRNPKTKIVMGGARANPDDRFAEVVMLGYGETHVVDFVKHLTGKNPFFRWQEQNGKMIVNHDVKGDKFKFNTSSIKWAPEDCVQPGEALPIEISRGCIFKCKFCFYPLNGKAKFDYVREKESLQQELLTNYQKYGTTRYIFSDDTYNDTIQKLEFMNDVVKGLPFTLEFATYARLDLIAAHREHAYLMKENGLKAVFFGIESLNHESGKAIGKGAQPEKLVETLHWLRDDVWKNDVLTSGGFIIGLPHDTYQTMTGWLERILDHRFPLHSLALTALRINSSLRKKSSMMVSEFDSNPEKYGYDVKPNGDWVNETYKTSLAGCQQMAHRAHEYGKEQGIITFTPHIIPAMIGLGYSYNEIIQKARLGIARQGSSHRTRSLFLSYLRSLFALEVA